jgi:hypothetical protein
VLVYPWQTWLVSRHWLFLPKWVQLIFFNERATNRIHGRIHWQVLKCAERDWFTYQEHLRSGSKTNFPKKWGFSVWDKEVSTKTLKELSFLLRKFYRSTDNHR